MNQEFIEWLNKQTFNLCAGGWYSLDMEYDSQMYWNWSDLKEWDE